LIFRQIPKLGISNFRIIRKHVVDQILQIPTPNPLVGLLILKVTERIGTIPVDHHERVHGKTTYSTARLVKHFMHGILYHSTLPLKGVFLLGVGTLCFAAILSIYYFVLFLMGSIKVPGWITIVLLLLFFSGISMFSVGIIGEYLLRIIQEVSHMPQYLIRDKEI
jgi:dolichol-phosphate mannosyltransferase/undecaprenyl-phosphate 4-deoxy-4-formamido-L-arabinose transferase